ncbi:serine/arginine repetitive matrix protein 1-like [Schistocerca americana]|uniref:serine/arginine repetitive matrix protein 1-like n=1 Tax=Schistocerca americana TaxID=7009 RepID=UPI001F4FED13|nr:serine/arginine repetitive matrix protein 1-like [Schistocerca americana]
MGIQETGAPFGGQQDETQAREDGVEKKSERCRKEKKYRELASDSMTKPFETRIAAIRSCSVAFFEFSGEQQPTASRFSEMSGEGAVPRERPVAGRRAECCLATDTALHPRSRHSARRPRRYPRPSAPPHVDAEVRPPCPVPQRRRWRQASRRPAAMAAGAGAAIDCRPFLPPPRSVPGAAHPPPPAAPLPLTPSASPKPRPRPKTSPDCSSVLTFSPCRSTKCQPVRNPPLPIQGANPTRNRHHGEL